MLEHGGFAPLISRPTDQSSERPVGLPPRSRWAPRRGGRSFWEAPLPSCTPPSTPADSDLVPAERPLALPARGAPRCNSRCCSMGGARDDEPSVEDLCSAGGLQLGGMLPSLGCSPFARLSSSAAPRTLTRPRVALTTAKQLAARLTLSPREQPAFCAVLSLAHSTALRGAGRPAHISRQQPCRRRVTTATRAAGPLLRDAGWQRKRGTDSVLDHGPVRPVVPDDARHAGPLRRRRHVGLRP